MIAGGADFALAPCAYHVTAAIFISAEKGTAALHPLLRQRLSRSTPVKNTVLLLSKCLAFSLDLLLVNLGWECGWLKNKGRWDQVHWRTLRAEQELRVK